MSRRGRVEPVDLRVAFAVALCVWILPTVGQWAMGAVTTRKLLYDVGTTVALQIAGLGSIAFVFRKVRARGASLTRSSAIATLATLPSAFIVFYFDLWLAAHDPDFTWVPPTFEQGPVVFVAAAITGAIAIAILQAGIVFLPLLARAHEERIRELESIQRDAELLRIRSHLEPHFILNSLNTVAGLVDEEPVQARAMIVALGDLFRRASKFGDAHRVVDEIDWLRSYARIHEIRHPDRIRFVWDVADDARDLPIPALLLQPLVENAIRHGALLGGSVVEVAVRREGATLVGTVSDDGPALGAPREGGQGLDIVRRRLAVDELADDAFTLGREGDRTVARVRLPIREGER